MIDYKDIVQVLDEGDDHDFIKDNAIAIAKELRACRNELCLKCGLYKEAHNGACKNCRWRDE